MTSPLLLQAARQIEIAANDCPNESRETHPGFLGGLPSLLIELAISLQVPLHLIGVAHHNRMLPPAVLPDNYL